VSTIVVLNGTSSSGKTALARAFQEIAPRLFLNFSIDSILYALPPSAVARLERGEPVPDLQPARLIPAFFACVRQLASLGHDLVIDHAITSEAEVEMLRSTVDGHQALLVGLDCPLEVLEVRERSRGDRRRGLAAAQYHLVHRWLEYDLRIDTSKVTPGAAAKAIVSALVTSR
jgi:chloramphenicol 3-O phosphotransferase